MVTARLLGRLACASVVVLLASVRASAQETPLVVSFESVNYRVLEGEELRVSVVLTPAPDREVTIPITAVPYVVAGAPAEEGDYTVLGLGAGGALTFAVGDAVETFVVRAEEDNRDNEIEDVELDFGSLPSGVTSARLDKRHRAMLRILDNDWKATLSKRDNWPPDRAFLVLSLNDPEGDELDWWLDGPDADYFLVEPYRQGGGSYGLFYLGWGTVWDSDVKDTYTFIFYVSDGRDEDGDPDGGLPDHRGVLVVTVTPGPEIVLQPASVPGGTETEVRIALSRFLPANDRVTISVGGQCGMDGTLGVTGGGTLSITTDGDGAANVVAPFTAGSVAEDKRCEVVATGSVVPTGSFERDAASAALVVERSGPEGPALTDVRANPETIIVGERSTLSWTPREDVESVVVRAGDEELATVFAATATSHEVWPTETTTYTLSAQDGEGAPLGDFPVTVTAVPPALTDVRADPETITVGERSTLSWTPREDIESVVVRAGDEELATVFAATATSHEVWPTETTTYTLSAQDGEGAPLGDFPVTVTAVPPALTDVRADPETITVGERSTLSWTPREDIESVVVRAGDEELATVFAATATSHEVWPTETTTYTLSAQDGEGAPLGDFPVTVTVLPRSGGANSPPVANDDRGRSVEFGEFITIQAATLLANDSDPDGDKLTLAAVSGAERGTVSVSGTTITFTHDGASAASEGYAFTYTVSDGNGGTDDAHVAGAVTETEANRAPTVSASCDPCEVAPGGEVRLSATASDPDDDPLTYAWTAPEGGFAGAADGATARWTAPARTGRVTIRVRVSDGRGGTASADVAVEVADRPPAFKQSVYRFELLENLDGSRRPVELGRVTAEDPEGDALTYELVSGDGGRFAIRARDGVVTYVGPGEDFETEPNRYDLVVRARDAFGAEARARVVVTVTDVNDAPEAVDDEAETPEDETVTVDVLANDTDADGDRLRVETVSAAAHGTAAVAGGAVTYAPEANYHGADRFTYVVSDGRGGTATATVDVTVLPVNDAPEAVDDEAETPEDETVTVDVLANDTDADGDRLRVETVSAAAHGTAAVAGGAAAVPWAAADTVSTRRRSPSASVSFASTSTVTVSSSGVSASSSTASGASFTSVTVTTTRARASAPNASRARTTRS